jgi:hypothetical protein
MCRPVKATPVISVDFWKGQPAGGSEGHTIYENDCSCAAHTRLAGTFHRIIAGPKTTNATKIRMAAGIREEFVNILFDHSFLSGRSGSANSHRSRGEIFRQNNRPIGAVLEFSSGDVR